MRCAAVDFQTVDAYSPCVRSSARRWLMVRGSGRRWLAGGVLDEPPAGRAFAGFLDDRGGELGSASAPAAHAARSSDGVSTETKAAR